MIPHGIHLVLKEELVNNPNIGESDVFLRYFKQVDTYKLKWIIGAGGNFYYRDNNK